MKTTLNKIRTHEPCKEEWFADRLGKVTGQPIYKCAHCGAYIRIEK